LLLNKNNNSVISIILRRASWFAVVPIALLQLTIVAHEFGHVADYTGSACHVCVQLDRLDAAVDHPAEIASVHSIDFLKSIVPVVSVVRTPVRNFDSRAPPQL
jgi:hypothetical protein